MITTDSDGGNGSVTGKVTGTDEHPFWVPSLAEWGNAGDLKSGMWLQTSTGSWTQITRVQTRTAEHRRVHNLTIAGTHTYYVRLGDRDAVVANCSGETVLGRFGDATDCVYRYGGNRLSMPA